MAGLCGGSGSICNIPAVGDCVNEQLFHQEVNRFARRAPLRWVVPWLKQKSKSSVLKLSRRGFLGLMLGPLAHPAPEAGTVVRGARQRTYSAQATILVFGMPAFSFRNVGGARARIDESPRQGSKTVALGFTAGSNPDKAHGLTGAIHDSATGKKAIFHSLD